MKRLSAKILAAAVTSLFTSAAFAADAEKPLVPNKIELKATPFTLADVQLLDGPFKDASERGQKYLLSLEPDRLLAGFREEAGLKARAPRYGGWESQGIAGHCLGHYLTALSMAYAMTKNEEFKRRATYIVAELAEVQKANGNGYASAIPGGKQIFGEVARGDIRSQGFDLNGSWVPWYTMHKIIAGVVDAYRYAGVTQAKPVLIGLCDWVDDTTKNLNEEHWQRMLACEQGGMNECLADAYALTGEKKFLAVSEKFTHHAIIDPLVAGRDELEGKHANTQVPKLVGSARQYELTGDADRRKASEFFWQTVTQNHSYVTGGNSDNEHFGPPRKLSNRLGVNTMETCNTNNMLRLTKHLYSWSGDVKFADYYERAVINHILASQDPATGRVTYYCTIKPGNSRDWQTLLDSFTCCVGTGMENHVRYNEEIYFHTADTLVVNQFIASQVDWAEAGVTLKQETKFPEQQSSKFTVVKAEKPFTLKLRVPKWTDGKATLQFNGKDVAVKATDGYVALKNVKAGDVVDLGLPMALHTESMPDKKSMVAVMYGPLVMAGKLDDQSRRRLPVFVGDDVVQAIRPAGDELLTFTADAKPMNVTLVPFYKAHDVPMTVYFDQFDQKQWATKEAEYRAEQEREEKLAKLTIDTIGIGEMQPERDHNLQSVNSSIGDHAGKKWRDARDGGNFAFDVKVDANSEQKFVVTYWGQDAGDREFDILIDGRPIASETLRGDQGDKFFDKTYDVPADLIKGKTGVRVTFQAKPGKIAGGIFGFRVVKAG